MKRIGKYGLGVLLILAGVAFWQRETIQVWWYAQKLEAAADADRQGYADLLAAHDRVGFIRLIDLWSRDHPELCDSIRLALENRGKQWGDKNPLFEQLATVLLEKQPRFSTSGQRSFLELLPMILNQVPEETAVKFRPTILAALSHSDPEIRAQAVVLGMRPDQNQLELMVPMLKDPAPEVRRAAMLAVGPADGDREPLISSDELLQWLHDPDPEVRRNCEIALGTRGLSGVEIQLGKQITHRSPVERLKMLLDLPDQEDFHLTPWLERLSRDPDSAVRAGAARVATERGIDFQDRLAEMISTDPDQTVRKIAEHYQKLAPRR